ncbi:Hypothetical predicted protein, partial [Paramuricea clavata]
KYYDATTKIVTDQLKTWLSNATDIDQEIKVPVESRLDLDVDTLAKLLPWSNDAVRGHWWSADMHCLVGDDLVNHAQAFKFSYFSVPWRPDDDFVEVSCYANNGQSQPDKTYTAR